MTASIKVCKTCGSALRPWGGCPHCTLGAMLAPEPDDVEDAAPATFGDYDLIEEIARGGAGVVWKAKQRRLGRIVALKILRETTLPGEEAARRFRFEGETIAQLRHPCIVTVHEIGEVGGRWFMSMELLEGGTLAGRKLPVREAVALLAKVARAVQYAHERGVIHRDLKPGNILLDAAGEPRVSDFGLARGCEDDADFTMAGVVLGTPAYMSPEQAAGLTRGLTTATDVYALGAMLYEMLTGGPVFHGDSQVELLRKVREEEPKPPSRITAGLDRDIEIICLKSLEKNPASRYQGAGSFAEDLERWLRGEPIHARVATTRERVWKWMRRNPAKAALIATTIAALVAISIVSVVFAARIERERVATLHRVARQHTQRALHFMEDGDANRGLLSLAEALAIGSGDPATDVVNRLRFASIARLGSRLEGLWFVSADEQLHGQFPIKGNVALITHGRVAQLADGPLLEHAANVTGADLNTDGSRIVCGTADGRWTLWDARAGKRIASGQGNVRAFPKSTASHTDGTFGGDRFVTVEGNVVRQFRAGDGAPAAPELRHPRRVQWAVLSPDGKKLFTFTEDGLLRTATADVPLNMAKPVGFEPVAEFQSAVQLESQGMLTVFDGADPRFAIVGWEYTHPETIDPKHKPLPFLSPAPVLDIGWLRPGVAIYMTQTAIGASRRNPWANQDYSTSFPHGTRVIAGSFDEWAETALTLAVNGAAQLWNMNDEGRRGPRLWAIGKPLDARLSSDGRSALIVTAAPAVWLWKWRANDGASAAFSAEEWKAFAGRADFQILWDGRATAQLAGGKKLTGVDAQTILIADAATGQSSAPPLVHPAAVTGASFSRDGHLLCTMWGGKFARVWETATGEPATPAFEHPDIADALWNADGNQLATLDRHGGARVWDLSPAKQSPAELMILARLLSAHRMIPGSDSGLIPLTAEELRAAWEAVRSKQ